MTRQEAASMMFYAWEDWRDLERHTQFDECMELLPEVARAWEDKKYSDRVVMALLKAAEEEIV